MAGDATLSCRGISSPAAVRLNKARLPAPYPTPVLLILIHLFCLAHSLLYRSEIIIIIRPLGWGGVTLTEYLSLYATDHEFTPSDHEFTPSQDKESAIPAY
jgi:hypothetical protein